MRKVWLGVIGLAFLVALAPAAQAGVDVWVSWDGGSGGDTCEEVPPPPKCEGPYGEGDMWSWQSPGGSDTASYRFELPKGAVMEKLRKFSGRDGDILLALAREAGIPKLLEILEVTGNLYGALTVPADTTDFAVLPARNGAADDLYVATSKGSIYKVASDTGALTLVFAQPQMSGICTDLAAFDARTFLLRIVEGGGQTPLYIADATTGALSKVPGSDASNPASLEMMAVDATSSVVDAERDGNLMLVDATGERFPVGPPLSGVILGTSGATDDGMLAVTTPKGIRVIKFLLTTYSFKTIKELRNTKFGVPIVAGMGRHPVADPVLALADASGNLGKVSHVMFRNPDGSAPPNLRSFVPGSLAGGLDGIGLDVTFLKLAPTDGYWDPFNMKVAVSIYDPSGIWSGRDLVQIYSLIYNSNGEPRLFDEIEAYPVTRYGATLAAGDVTGDGYDELITGAGPGAVFGPQVKVWEFEPPTVTFKTIGNFFAYGTMKYGVNVAGGDVDGDGIDEIITGAGPGDVFGPHVRGWEYDGKRIKPLPISFFAFGTLHFGASVGTGDLNGDGRDEILVGPGPGSMFPWQVRSFDFKNGKIASGSANFLYQSSTYGTASIASHGRTLFSTPGPAPTERQAVTVHDLNSGKAQQFEATSDPSRVFGCRMAKGVL